MNFFHFTDRVDRRKRYGTEYNSPFLRENLLSRDKKLVKPRGTRKVISTVLTDIATWGERYYSIETGVIAPKSFVYTQDGKVWHINELSGIATDTTGTFNTNAYPKSCMFKSSTQTLMYFVDGESLWKYDGNADFKFEKVNLVDSLDKSVKPIDCIVHNDRLVVISEAFMFISANLAPDVFDDATDSIQLVIGSGRGKNKALGKIEDNLFIFTSEGIYGLFGDVISAVASTFEVQLVDNKKTISGRTVVSVENAINFLGDDLEIWSFDGNSSKMLSYTENLKQDINNNRNALDRATAIYHDNYYKLSVVKNGDTKNKLEFWWDALENKIEFITNRNVSCYLKTDPSREREYMLLGCSLEQTVLWEDVGTNFNGEAIDSRLRTKDITISKGRNVRLDNFYIEIEPYGSARTIEIKYLLDSRLSDLDLTAKFTQSLVGDVKEYGLITIQNQKNVMYRQRPQIKYSKGTSICFDMIEATLDLRMTLYGIGFDTIDKGKIKGRHVGK